MVYFLLNSLHQFKSREYYILLVQSVYRSVIIKSLKVCEQLIWTAEGRDKLQ